MASRLPCRIMAVINKPKNERSGFIYILYNLVFGSELAETENWRIIIIKIKYSKIVNLLRKLGKYNL